MLAATPPAAIYLEETGNALPTSVSNSQFRQWRQAKVTQFAQQLSAAVRAARPDILLSVSPSITGFSDTEYNAKWTDWQDQGLFDEFVPQAYRNNLTSFNSIIDAQVASFEPNDLGELTVGTSVNTSGANTSFNDIAGKITRARAEGAAGHSLWYNHGVRDDYPAQLTAFYNVAADGRAANPHFASDRRPLEVPDFNGDGSVDAADYTLWRDTLGSALDLRADANADGAVDLVDYDFWKSGFGSTPASASVSVQEPTIWALLVAALLPLSVARIAPRIPVARSVT